MPPLALRLTVLSVLVLGASAGCTTRSRDVGDSGNGLGTDTDGLPGHDSGNQFNVDTGTSCTNGSCYTLYAHSNHTLYSVDLAGRTLTTVGRFNAPHVGTSEDTMTDLAVAPDGTIYVVSHTTLYTASATNGQVTRVETLASCGTENVALSFGPDGTLYAGDFSGAFCHIDVHMTPPMVTRHLTLSGGYALSGDIVVVGDGTMFGTVYRIGDASGTASQANNILARINPADGTVTPLGATGFPNLFGTAYQNGQVFGFTHDGSGDVVTIDRMTGVGTRFGTFMDATTHTGISFAGAGVNANVPIAPM